MLTRRNFLAGLSLPFALTGAGALAQQATPAATPVPPHPPTTADVLPAWRDAQAALSERGAAAATALFQNDREALISISTPEVAAALADENVLEDMVASFTQNQIHFVLPELGIAFFGRYTPEAIRGIFVQGGPMPWEILPEEPQTGDAPAGTWTGTINHPRFTLDIRLDFSGGADDLAVTLSVPSQLMMNVPMENVLYQADLPIGAEREERSIPAGGDVTDVNLYGVEYEWGSQTLGFDSDWSEDGRLSGFSLVPYPTLPPETSTVAISARLPFDGAWMVAWGGTTVFRNYHAATPPQRYATDLLLWRDGSSAMSPGTEPEHYHAFGQPYLAPVSGTVVEAVDGYEDITPQGPPNANDFPAGNHIVIEVDEGFVFLAHCMNGSVRVKPGDTVEAGMVVAAIGNSGNTSEPHVHIHAQTSVELFDPQAIGIPLVYQNISVDGEHVEEGMPLHGTIIEQLS